ncbi:MAG: dethiobiotin synthase [Buchnera aphidicola (Schlechtendalia peitan)]
MNNCWFITGTDTNIGKTICSILLLKLACNNGYNTAGYKPIASGSYNHGNKNEDAILLQRFSTIKLKYKEINPFFFIENTSPHIASKKHSISICKKKISLGLYNLKKKSNYILIEGAGGWFTPFSETETIADWVIEEKLNVILVVGIRLGCINHAILTQKAILDSNLKISGWIANYILPNNRYDVEYVNTLKKFLQSKCLGYVKHFRSLNKFYNSKITITLPDFL